MNRFDSFVENSKILFPNLKIKFKTESLFMKILGKLMFFNKEFMFGMITTICNTVYFTSKEYVINNEIDAIDILCHELIHVYDYNKFKLLFLLGYIFPQILAIFSILSIWNIWFILFLLFLLPIPAPLRAKAELRGYIMDLTIIMSNRSLSKNDLDWATNMFTSSLYYFMCPFRKYIEKKLIDGANNKEKVYSDILILRNKSIKG